MCSFKLYADDIILYHPHHDCSFLQDNLNSFLDWCSRWQMSLQPHKCEALCISNKRSLVQFTYYCSVYPLQWSKSVRYLGIVVNNHLTWSDQCRSVCSKATGVLNLLRRKLYCCSTTAKSCAFCALVLPILQYFCRVLLSHYQQDISILELVQRWAAHWVCNSKLNPSCCSWSPSTDICISRLGWPFIMNRFTASCSLFLFDLLHNKFAMSFNDYFQFNTSSTNSHSLTLVCKQSVINSYRNSFFCGFYFYLE